MKNLHSCCFTLLLSYPATAFTQAAQEPAYSLAAIQGAWWADCDAPAAEFFIHDNTYSGDFDGSFAITLTGDVLVFTNGFAEGHSVNVTHAPLSFRIMELAEGRLVLRPLAADSADASWHLQSCEAEVD